MLAETSGTGVPMMTGLRTIALLSSDDKSPGLHWLIEAFVSGLPDAVIALDRNDCVVAWNEAAQKIAPALARNKPLSLALRNPDIIDAVRRAGGQRPSRTYQYHDRCRSINGRRCISHRSPCQDHLLAGAS
jgi:PAS domain-containing protein